jgi:hypothetical protein
MKTKRLSVFTRCMFVLELIRCNRPRTYKTDMERARDRRISAKICRLLRAEWPEDVLENPERFTR